MLPLPHSHLHRLGQSARVTTDLIAVRLKLRAILRSRPLPAVLAVLTPPRAPRASVPMPILDRAIHAAEDILSRLGIVPDTCLYRSLARYAVFRRAGHRVRFVMGIQRNVADITGHAWIELDGQPYDESPDPEMIVTFSYPGVLS